MLPTEIEIGADYEVIVLRLFEVPKEILIIGPSTIIRVWRHMTHSLLFSTLHDPALVVLRLVLTQLLLAVTDEAGWLLLCGGRRVGRELRGDVS